MFTELFGTFVLIILGITKLNPDTHDIHSKTYRLCTYLVCISNHHNLDLFLKRYLTFSGAASVEADLDATVHWRKPFIAGTKSENIDLSG